MAFCHVCSHTDLAQFETAIAVHRPPGLPPSKGEAVSAVQLSAAHT